MNHVFIDSGVIQDWSVVAPRKKKWNLTKKKKRASHREAACSSSIMFSASEPARTNPVSVSASASSHWTTWPRTWWQSWMSLAAQLQDGDTCLQPGGVCALLFTRFPRDLHHPLERLLWGGKKNDFYAAFLQKGNAPGRERITQRIPFVFTLVLFCFIFFPRRGSARCASGRRQHPSRAQSTDSAEVLRASRPGGRAVGRRDRTGRWGASLTMVRHTICTCETLHVTYQGAEVVEERRGEERGGEERGESGHRFRIQDWTESIRYKFYNIQENYNPIFRMIN